MGYALTAADLLNVWERGLTQSPVQRALALLAACADTPVDTLAQLSIGQRDARLLTLREWAFGSQIVGVASCPGCGELSLNLVSGTHLDVPFYHDKVVRYVDRPFGDGRDLTVEGFHHQLHSARFDSERADLG